MPEYTIRVSEEVAEYVRSEARRSGGMAEGEVLAVLVERGIAAGEENGEVLRTVRPHSGEEIEQLLADGLESESLGELTPELWQGIVDSIEGEMRERERGRART